MRLGFDIGPLTASRTGVGNYCYYLLKHLLEPGDLDIAGLAVNRRGVALDGLEGRLTYRHIRMPARAMFALWNAAGVPRADRLLGGVDVYHATNYVLPPVARAKTVLTIHDLAFLIEPAWCSPRIVGPFSRRIAAFAGQAGAIMAYSEATAADIVRLLGVERDKITVAPMAVDEGFAPMDRSEAARLVRDTWGVEGPFLLFVSTLEPRKNVTGLIRIFERIGRDFPHKLVLIGGMGWGAGPIAQALESSPMRSRIVRPGFVPHRKLPAFYCAADAFVFPTHYEGFGLPLLEALTCGCPVAASDSSSVPEVTGTAALRAAPGDIEAHAAHIAAILTDAALRERLVADGKAHASRYSWRACAASTRTVYERLAAS